MMLNLLVKIRDKEQDCENRQTEEKGRKINIFITDRHIYRQFRN
jgi:hypothetical protein